MVWLFVLLVVVGVFALMYFATGSIFDVRRWILVFVVTLVYGVVGYECYTKAVTRNVEDTTVVLDKRTETVENTKQWSVVYHYLLCADGLEYWVSRPTYDTYQVDDVVNVEYVLYEGKIKKYKVKGEFAWLLNN